MNTSQKFFDTTKNFLFSFEKYINDHDKIMSLMKKADFIMKFKKYKMLMIENDNRMISLNKRDKSFQRLVVIRVDKKTALIYYLNVFVLIRKTHDFFQKCITFEYSDGKTVINTY